VGEERSIPNVTFRIEPGYTLPQEVKSPELAQNNVLVGKIPASTKIEANYLGRIAEYQRNKNVWLDTEGAHAVYVVGKRRSGKTYTLGVIAESLASDKWIRQGDEKQAILLLDTMNVFITMPYGLTEVYAQNSSKIQEMRRWGLQDEKFNIVFFYPKGTQQPSEGVSRQITIKPSDLTGEDWASLFGVDTYADPVGQLIGETYEKVVLEGYQDTSGETIAAEKDYSIDHLLNCIDYCPGISRYEAKTVEAVRRRFKAIRRLPIFSHQGLDMQEIFSAGQISVLLLRDLDQNLRSLLVAVLVKKIMELRSLSDRFHRLASVQLDRFTTFKSEGNQEKADNAYNKYLEYQQKTEKGLPRGWLIIDEAHNYMPTRMITPSNEPLRKYVNEGRNLGLSIVVATQNPSALDPSIRRNADVLIIHSISMKDDLAATEGMINALVPDSFEFGHESVSSHVFEQLVRSLPLGYALISNDMASRVFVTKIRPRLTIHGGMEY